jgi:hypothetical protein
MQRSDIHEAAVKAVNDRSAWEGELANAYLRRKRKIRGKKAYPGASNLVLPLCDTIVRKLTPFYTAQLTATELPAKFTFLGPKEQRGPERDMAELFGWHVFRQGQFVACMRRVIDSMLTYRLGWLHLGWDAGEKRLVFKAKLPLYVIAPPWATDIQESPWVVVIEHHTPEQLAEQGWCEVKNVKELKSLTGRVGEGDSQRESWEEIKRSSEGVTYDQERVVVWHAYCRKAGKVYVESWCPQKPTLTLRKQTPIAIDRYPLVDFRYDKTEEGQLSGESIISLTEENEAYASKVWQSKSNMLAWSALPLLTRKAEVKGAGANLTNLKHGDVLDGDVQAVQFPTPPVQLDNEIAATRLVAQEHVGMPDLALNQAKGGQRTATEAEMAGGLLSVATDDRARQFREDLANVYGIAWKILVAFEAGGGEFFKLDGTGGKVDLAALKQRYLIEPEGTPGTWDRGATFQKLVQLAQTVGQTNSVEQDELVRMLVEAVDPRWAKRLLRDKTRDATISLMGILDGLNALALKLDADGAPDDPVTMQAIMELTKEVLAKLAQVDPQKAQQAAQAIQQSQQAAQGGAQITEQMGGGQ